MARRRRRSRPVRRDGKGGWLGFWLVLGGVFLFRTFLYQPFTIPSGSMQPGLLEGDYIIVSKAATGYGKHSAWPIPLPVSDRIKKSGPERGDIIVFRPEDVRSDVIKRVLAVPGDRVRMSEDTVYVNDEPLTVPDAVAPAVTVKEPRGAQAPARLQVERAGDTTYATAQLDPELSGFEELTVPEGYYFVMGDNRDRSGDSRLSVAAGGVGLVPSAGIVGEAKLVLLSVEDDFTLWKPWTWHRIRGDRWFTAIG